MRKCFFFILLSVFLVCSTHAQVQNFSFNNLNEKNGLADNIIFCMLKDSRGILWVGTQNGLSRFDGSNFYNFKKKSGSNSLPHNSIESICEDKQGNIWGGTDNGIFRYSALQNKFENYSIPNEGGDKLIHNISCDKQGNIFATTSFALLQFNDSKNKFEKIYGFNNNKDSLVFNSIGKNRMLYDVANHGLWMALTNGLYYYEITSKKVWSKSNSPNQPLFNMPKTSALALSPNGNIWFYTNATHELVEFNPKTKGIIQKINLSHVPDMDRVNSMLIDSKQRIWLSTWAFDIMCVHTKEANRIEHLHSDVVNYTSLAGNFFWDALEDSNGSIWIGTANGISICNADNHLYKANRLPEKIPELKSTELYLVKEDPYDKTWWLSTGRNELIHYFPKNGTYKMFYPNQFPANVKGKKPGNIFDMHFESDKNLLTTGYGMWQYNKATQTFKPYTSGIRAIDTLVIYHYLATDSLNFYSDRRTLVSLNKNSKQVSSISLKTNEIKNLEFHNLMWKPNQNLAWLGAKDYVGNLVANKKVKITPLLKDTITEAGGYFHAADLDDEGNVWVINKGVGLYKYNPKNNSTKYYTDFDGLVNNHLHAVLADKHNNIWCAYYNKVSVFNKTKNQFTNFTIPYGEAKTIYFNNLNLRTDGVVMGNVYNDVFEFYAENLNRVPVITKPQFSVVSISGKDYFPDESTVLYLNPEQNAMTINFGCLLDATSFPHGFEYNLKGLDKEWHNVAGSNEVNFTNLPPGTYTFRLVAKGKNNNWKSAENVFHFTIKTPFYKSIWFLVVMGLLIVGSIYLLYRYRIRQQEKLMLLEGKAQILEKEKAMVMYDSLKQQLNPHFLFNSLTSLSGLIATNQEVAGDFLEQMSGIYRYILKNGDKESVTLKDELTFVKLYITLQQTRFKKGLLVNVNVSEEYHHYKIAPVTLQNLIENAIKHNIIDTETPLVVDIFIEGEYIVVKNNLQKKNMVETSNKKGLAQFETLYKYLSGKPVLIEETTQTFIIKIPLI